MFACLRLVLWFLQLWLSAGVSGNLPDPVTEYVRTQFPNEVLEHLGWDKDLGHHVFSIKRIYHSYENVCRHSWHYTCFQSLLEANKFVWDQDQQQTGPQRICNLIMFKRFALSVTMSKQPHLWSINCKQDLQQIHNSTMFKPFALSVTISKQSHLWSIRISVPSLARLWL